MKNSLLALYALSALFFLSCSPSDCLTGILKLVSEEDETVIFVPKGETITVPITSLLAWKVISSPDWVTVTPMNGPGGVGDADVLLTAGENNTEEPRDGYVVIVDTAGNRLRIYVYQGVPVPLSATLTVTPPELTFAHNESGSSVGTDNVTITTNQSSWTSSAIPTWLTISEETGGSGVSTISIYPAAPNTGSTPLTATITITAGALTETITVTQGIDTSPTLTVTPPTLFFAYNETVGTDNVTITTNQDTWAATIEYHQGSGWLSFPVSGAGNPTGGTISVYPTSNNASYALREATITITAGGLTETFTVSQGIDVSTIPGAGTPIKFDPYVGAFWRAEQTGERILRFANIPGANSGDWKASVVWMDNKWASGDIVLDTELLDFTSLSNRGINFSTVIPNGSISDAEDYQLSGSALSVSGTVASGGEIIFRIGLKSNFATYHEFNNPARYAVVLLSYNLNGTPKHQKIFLRQGQGADNVSNVTSPLNYTAVKWSPYNVGNYNNQNQYGFNKIVDFPTKAGYYYPWGYGASTTPFPYSPYDPVSPEWVPSATPWNYALGDACPAGYKVPSGIGSETSSQQRDWDSLAKLSDAAVDVEYGNYADGFYDRRMIESVVSIFGFGLIYGRVSEGNSNVAYIGNLAFNTTTNASLFFPSAGFRFGWGASISQLGYPCEEGTYLTSSTKSDFVSPTYNTSEANIANCTLSWLLFPSFFKPLMNSDGSRATAYPVRCVRDTP